MSSRPPTEMVLTGVVTTNHITVSPQITGRLTELQVREGDVVKAGQMLAVLAPDELREERASTWPARRASVRRCRRAKPRFVCRSGRPSTRSPRPRRRWPRRSRKKPPRKRSSRTPPSCISAIRSCRRKAWRRRNRSTRPRRPTTSRSRGSSRSVSNRSGQGRGGARERSAEQIAMRRSQVLSNRKQQAAAAAQRAKADVRLTYTEIKAPIDGIVDACGAARRGRDPGNRSSPSSIPTISGSASISRKPTSTVSATATR